jgi:predicted nucleic acid-binding protein
MADPETLILLDADVISHFLVAGRIDLLSGIFDAPKVILSAVFDELSKFAVKLIEVEQLEYRYGLRIMPFPEDDERVFNEYFSIRNSLFCGAGETQIMAVARFHGHIVASSNIADVRRYCTTHGIRLLTTMDFLNRALDDALMVPAEVDSFLKALRAAGSRLPCGNWLEFEAWRKGG